MQDTIVPVNVLFDGDDIVTEALITTTVVHPLSFHLRIFVSNTWPMIPISPNTTVQVSVYLDGQLFLHNADFNIVSVHDNAKDRSTVLIFFDGILNYVTFPLHSSTHVRLRIHNATNLVSVSDNTFVGQYIIASIQPRTLHRYIHLSWVSNPSVCNNCSCPLNYFDASESYFIGVCQSSHYIGGTFFRFTTSSHQLMLRVFDNIKCEGDTLFDGVMHQWATIRVSQKEEDISPQACFHLQSKHNITTLSPIKFQFPIKNFGEASWLQAMKKFQANITTLPVTSQFAVILSVLELKYVRVRYSTSFNMSLPTAITKASRNSVYMLVNRNDIVVEGKEQQKLAAALYSQIILIHFQVHSAGAYAIHIHGQCLPGGRDLNCLGSDMIVKISCAETQPGMRWHYNVAFVDIPTIAVKNRVATLELRTCHTNFLFDSIIVIPRPILAPFQVQRNSLLPFSLRCTANAQSADCNFPCKWDSNYAICIHSDSNICWHITSQSQCNSMKPCKWSSRWTVCLFQKTQTEAGDTSASSTLLTDKAHNHSSVDDHKYEAPPSFIAIIDGSQERALERVIFHHGLFQSFYLYASSQCPALAILVHKRETLSSSPQLTWVLIPALSLSVVLQYLPDMSPFPLLASRTFSGHSVQPFPVSLGANLSLSCVLLPRNNMNYLEQLRVIYVSDTSATIQLNLYSSDIEYPHPMQLMFARKHTEEVILSDIEAKNEKNNSISTVTITDLHSNAEYIVTVVMQPFFAVPTWQELIRRKQFGVSNIQIIHTLSAPVGTNSHARIERLRWRLSPLGVHVSWLVKSPQVRFHQEGIATARSSSKGQCLVDLEHAGRVRQVVKIRNVHNPWELYNPTANGGVFSLTGLCEYGMSSSRGITLLPLNREPYRQTVLFPFSRLFRDQMQIKVTLQEEERDVDVAVTDIFGAAPLLDAPKMLTLAAGLSILRLSFDKVDHASIYQIEVLLGENMHADAYETPDTTLTIRELPHMTQVRVRVRAFADVTTGASVGFVCDKARGHLCSADGSFRLPGEWSGFEEARTLGLPPTSIPTILHVAAISNITAHIGVEMVGNISHRVVIYAEELDSIGARVQTYRTMPSLVSSSDFHVILAVSPLQPSAWYRFSAAFSSFQGDGPRSAAYYSVIRMADGIPDSPRLRTVRITQQEVSRSDQRNVIVQWTSSRNDFGAIIGFILYYGNQLTRNENKIVINGSTANSHVLIGLERGNTYSISITAMSVIGESKRSNAMMITLPITSPSTEASKLETSIVVATVIGSVVVATILIAGAVYFFHCNVRKNSSKDGDLSMQLGAWKFKPEDICERACVAFRDEFCNVIDHLDDDVGNLFEQMEIQRSKLRMGQEIGKGAFGIVYQASIFGRVGEQVAVKTLLDGVIAEELVRFLVEGRIMAMLEHDNIVQLIGVCTEEIPPYLVVEHMSKVYDASQVSVIL